MFEIKQVCSYKVEIFIAGSFDQIKQVCLEHCSNVGLCVTVTSTDYVYSRGTEKGAIIGLINYARFPSDKNSIWEKAEKLAYILMDRCFQRSATIQDCEKSLLIQRII